ncbi:MAG: heavy metal translocating P-type ATPase [Verrucomicrobiota bacterium]|jgi:Cu+-exporting ATPase
METRQTIPSAIPENSAATELLVGGMNCQNCARHVTDAIQGVPGVRSATVMLETGRATVRWNSGAQQNIPAVIQAVKQAGYEAKELQAGSTTELLVSGMTCTNCARHVTDAIQGVPGVRSASVSLEAGRATVRWNSGAQQNIPAVIRAVAEAGYAAKSVEAAAHDHGEHRQSRWQWNLLLGVFVTAFLMIGEWGFSLGLKPWFQWLSFALAGAVQIFAGAQFYRGAWHQLKIGSSNMDTLVALGSTTAFGYSAWALFTGLRPEASSLQGGAGGHVYFMEAAAIITLISIGHWLEARASDRASGALKSLLNLAPQTARRIPNSELRTPNSEVEVPVSELKTGDLVVLKPGDRVPVDGMVTAGDSAVDEAMLTGESVPTDKKTGSELFTGTVNLNGRLVMRVTATGESTALAHIIAAVQRAQTSRADIQRLGDRVSSVFVPVVVAIAIAAGLWWGFAPEAAGRIHDALARFFWHAHTPAGVAAGFIIAAAVLIIACPCAMGLATPAAIMAGANAAARRGILIRDGVALEKAGKITAVVFDKTGTITEGKPSVARVWENLQSAICNPKFLAASLARHSTHPISRAIAKISTEIIELADWKEIRGCGVEAKLQPSTARLGSLRWLKESGVALAAGEKFITEWSGQGATIVGLASDKTLLGLFAVRDTVKPNAAKVIEQLQQQGLKTFLVTGDNSLTAASIAKQVGIEGKKVFAEVRPEQKAEFVKKLQAQGERVAFVGDGINDAPALTQADLGVAVSRASDIAREAADIILLKSEIEAVPEALGLARATLHTIKQNLFWAFFYNALGVPLAALGFISPIFCAAAMGASDLIVIGNALRLSRWRQS